MNKYIIIKEKNEWVDVNTGINPIKQKEIIESKDLDSIVKKYYEYVNQSRNHKYHYSVKVLDANNNWLMDIHYFKGKPVVFKMHPGYEQVVRYPITKDHKIGRWHGGF